MKTKIEVNVTSEIGELENVIVHSPGPEVEDMTPQNAERALYSDILNLSVASREYKSFKRVLKKVAVVHEVEDLLKEVIKNEDARKQLVQELCKNECVDEISEYLASLDSAALAGQLIRGVPLNFDNLTNYLSNEKYALRPLHNFFFTRDSAAAIRKKVLIAKMASKVREREAIIMESIFHNHPMFDLEIVNPVKFPKFTNDITIEGGDITVVRDDVLLVGISDRTSSRGIDFMIDRLKEKGEKRHIIAQVLPREPESFIHLDMVFTLLDVDKCAVYPDVIFNPHDFQTIHIIIDNGKVSKIFEEPNIVEALNKLGIHLETVTCGGNADKWTQEREQWHSGANFFAFAPGKILGYARNVHTIEELDKHGFEVVKASQIISGKQNLNDYKKCVVTIEGEELSRGGGGCRCMTMPIRRKSVSW
ncbi:MAG: arginine deiminase [Ignavibacteriae bacterium]|nr:arginine deiminase [Ignavibacteriota bacterium]NOG97874.1 arginine deiminase [Ignavibacteriota bacterium]